MDIPGYVRRFNAAVRDGDWAPVLAAFSPDAVMEFLGPPVGPFVGRAAIGAAYSANPPDDEIALAGEPSVIGDSIVTSYRWVTTGATGTMRFTERAGLIAYLLITFD